MVHYALNYPKYETLMSTKKSEFEIKKKGSEACQLIQTARFRPRGLWGILYWCLLLPFHGFASPIPLGHAENGSRATAVDPHVATGGNGMGAS